MTRILPVLVLLVALTQGRLARSTEIPSPNDIKSTSPEATAWGQAYAKARADMLAGQFAAAADQFQALVVSAPDSAARLVATELLGVCLTWSRDGMALLTKEHLALRPPALLGDRRTIDELSVLYLTSVLYGAYTGIVFDVHNKAHSTAGNVMPPLLFAGAAAGTVALLDYQVGLGYGVANSIVTGMLLGFEEAYAWMAWHEASASYSDKWSDTTTVTLPWALGTAGAIAGGLVGNAVGTTPGKASLMGSGALWSALVAGTMVGAILPDNGHSDDHALLTAAIALNAGALGAMWLGSSVNPSVARVRFLDLGAISGGLLFGGLYMSAAGKDSHYRPFLGSLSVGMATGLALSWYLTRDMDPDMPRKGNAPTSVAARMLPTIMPADRGAGALFGLAGTI